MAEGKQDEVLGKLTDAQTVSLVRAFSNYFNLANVAEQVDRTKVLAEQRKTIGSWISRTIDRILKVQESTKDLVLEVACEYGIQTVLLLLLLFLYVFHLSYHKMIKYKNDKTSFYPLLFYLFLFFFFNSLVSGMLNDSRLLFVVISCIIIHKPLISTNE